MRTLSADQPGSRPNAGSSRSFVMSMSPTKSEPRTPSTTRLEMKRSVYSDIGTRIVTTRWAGVLEADCVAHKR